jgi:hypothetical protein
MSNTQHRWEGGWGQTISVKISFSLREKIRTKKLKTNKQSKNFDPLVIRLFGAEAAAFFSAFFCSNI